MSSSSNSSPESPRCSLSNLERFLLSVTPNVPSKTLFQSGCNDLNRQWLPLDKDVIESFALRDLWESYYEWSACGAGTPVMLENGETLMQYYVPYLSAIQIYTNKPVVRHNEGAEAECESWSDDSGSDNPSSISPSNNSSKAWDAVSMDSGSDQVVASWPTKDMLGHLYLDYNELSSPFMRVPFAEKITELARSHPAIMTLKSVDLSPASWVAVAWYPIYPIPSQKYEKESACFLTYHTLSSSFDEQLLFAKTAQKCFYSSGRFILLLYMDGADKFEEIDIRKDLCCLEEWRSIVKKKWERSDCCKSLYPFGLSTYKMQSNIWLNPSADNERIFDLYGAAESWVKQLNVHHHDFNFFRANN